MDLAWLGTGLFAQRSPWDPRLLWATVILVAAILAGALLIVLIDRWRRRTADEDNAPTANDQLAEFRAMYERGAMSQEEFDRIRGLLGGKLREELDVPAAPPPAPGANGPPSAAPPGPPTP